MKDLRNLSFLHRGWNSLLLKELLREPTVSCSGEFELMILDGTWLDVPECQNITHAHCDLTFDLGSDSDYNIRVRAECESEMSPWTQLSPAFNRKDTVLTVPHMVVSAPGHALQVTFDQVPPTASISVMVWKQGNEAQMDVYTISAEEKVLHVAALQDGEVYCIRAWMVLEGRIQSGSTEIHCEPIKGAHATWKSPTNVVVTLVVMACVLFAVVWAVVHCHVHAYCQCLDKEALPRSLRTDWDVDSALSMYPTEVCAHVHLVHSGEQDRFKPLPLQPDPY
ncbi:cytokine receptor family member B16 isoform X2 [Dunckerocampus dactyliophorus]|uniref:cytokine receptor family member B16 isoform X2 n=1 Tax=Dunckerocampus dactyliophorus TaxID=161453 RepID=UPI002406E0C3|nr:cytokine receptor family member B16 isoform X2 [Dunckerocampus dactyliophorus]